MASWENWQKPVKGESSYQGQLFQTLVVPRKGEISHCLFLSKFILLWIWFCGAHLLVLSLAGTAVSFMFVSFLCSESLAWLSTLPGAHRLLGSCICRQLNHQVWGPKIWPDRNVGCIPFVGRVIQTVASSQGSCLSLFFSFGYLLEWLWILGG